MVITTKDSEDFWGDPVLKIVTHTPMVNKPKTLLALLSVVIGGSVFLFAAGLQAQPNVLTFHNDLARTGANLNETILTPGTVKNGFGKLFSHTLDGYVFAQPLYMAGVPVNGLGRHNVVFVATEADSVYAFDADNAGGTNANPLWQTSFGNGSSVVPIPTDVFGGQDENFGCFAVNPSMGITGTPVIDPASKTLYVVAATKEISGASANYVTRLHAIDITTGLEKPGSGMAVSAPPGAAYNPLYMVQRTGLLLLNGKIYLGYASTCDHGPYNGFLAVFDATTLQQVNMFFQPSPGFANEGGIWGGGGAPAVDSTGNIYIGVGNGSFDGNTSFGSSLVKLNSQLQVTDYFSPFDVNSNLNPADLDLGSSMPIILPDSAGLPGHPHLMALGGKGKLLYLVDRDNLEHWEPSNNTLLPAVPQYVGGGIFGRSVFYNGNIYVSPGYSNIQSFSVLSGLAPVSSTTKGYAPWVGASLAISANANTNGLLWVQSGDGDGFSPGGSNAVLEAYDATTLGNPIYSSANSPSDSFGVGERWSVPIAVQGKVYAGTGLDHFNGVIAAFGLTNASCATDVSSQVIVTRGGWKFNRATNSYGETLTLTNTGSTTLGPVSVVYDALSSFATVTSGGGTTSCGSLTGSFYQTPTGTVVLSPGQSVAVFLVATSSTTQTILFNTRILAGNGIR
jgi:hypothetical protein